MGDRLAWSDRLEVDHAPSGTAACLLTPVLPRPFSLNLAAQLGIKTVRFLPLTLGRTQSSLSHRLLLPHKDRTGPPGLIGR